MKKVKREEKKFNYELVIFIICVILIASFFLVMIGMKERLNNKEKNEKEQETANDETIEHVDLDYAQEILDRITYPIILYSGNDSFDAAAYYYSKNILVKNMSMESKVLIAVLNTIGECTDESCYLLEDDVIQTYTELFGTQVAYNFPKSKYMKLEDDYIVLNKKWKTNSNGFVFTKITDATQSNTELKIYVKVAFQYDSTLFYDYQLTNIIEEVSTCTSNDDLDYYNNLYQYVYTFKIEDGNYVFYSVTKK